MQKTVLITGASSGLGQVMAGLLAQRGFSVWGTSRKTGQDMSDSDCKMLPMDLQDADSIKAAVKRIKETEVQSRFHHGKIFCVFKKDTARAIFRKNHSRIL